MRKALSITVLLACFFAATAGWSQDKAEEDMKDAARSLTALGKQKLESGDYKGALQAFTDAEKYHRAPTISFLRASAHEKLGQLVEAEALYKSVASEALAADAPAAFLSAQQSSKASLGLLAKRIPTLSVRVRGILANGRVLVDGVETTAAGRESLRLNPGRHEIVVEVAGEAKARRGVDLKEGAMETVDIEAGPPVPAPSASPSQMPTTMPTGNGSSSASASRPATAAGSSWVWPAVAFGVGGAGLVVGVVTGAITFGKMGEVRALCGADLKCSPTQSEELGLDSARAVGHVSTAGFVIGGAGVVLGTVLMLTLPRGKTPAKVGLSVGLTSMSVNGAF